MKLQKPERMRVRITGDHPHRGKRGTIKANKPDTIELSGETLVRVDLDTGEGCFASRENIALENKPSRRTTWL